MSDSVVPTAPTAQPRRQLRNSAGSRDFKQHNLAGYLFLSPWLIAFLLFTLVPMAISLWLAFTNYDTLSNQGTFIGLGNFQRMFFEDPRYGRAVKATVQYVVLSVPLRLAAALGIAMLLNTYRRGVYLYRAAYYIPSIIGGSVAVAVMWRQLFGSEGLVNAAIAFLGIAPVRWLGDPTHGDLDVGLAGGLAVRLADADLPRRAAPNSGIALRSRRNRRRGWRRQILQHHPAAADADHFLQPDHPDDRRVQDVHASLYRDRRDGRAAGYDPVLCHLPLQPGVQPVPDGLRGSDGVGAAWA